MNELPGMWEDADLIGGETDSVKTPCKPGKHDWKVICCGKEAGPDRDIIECRNCGKQINVSCSFDDDFS